MPSNIYDDAVIITGINDDETQLTVQARTDQDGALQNWETSGGADTLARLTGDGRLQIGSFDEGVMATDESLIEAHRAETDTTKPKRGLHLLGAISGTLSTAVSWIVQELTLKGTSGISALHTALRVRLRNEATGSMTSTAELRGGDIEVINAGGASGSPVTSITGLRVAVDQETSAAAASVYGVKVELTDTPSGAYAVHTNTGKIHFGNLSTGLVRADASGDLTSTPFATTDIPNGAITLPKLATTLVHSAASAPTPNDDSGDGYGVGSMWIDTSTDKTYICVDATLGAAQWPELTNPSSGTTLDAVNQAAGETWSERDNLYFDPASKTWKKIDNDADPIAVDSLRGVAVANNSSPSSTNNTIRLRGLMTGYSELTGDVLYASGAAGGSVTLRPTVSAGGGQVVICEMGRVLSDSSVWIDPKPIAYLKRASLSNNGTLTILHHSDPQGRKREARAYVSSTATSVAEANSSLLQNTGVDLKRTGTITITPDSTGT